MKFAFWALSSICLAAASDVVDLNKGHCKALAPEFEKAAAELKELKLKIAKVDCTVEADVCAKLDVKGYPTLKVFRNGAHTDYKGARSAEGIVDTLKKQSLPALSLLKDVAAVNTFSSSSKVVIVGFYEKESSEAFKTFKELANQHRDDFVFGYTLGNAVAKAMDMNVPQLVLYKTFDEGKNLYEGDFTDAEKVVEFIKANSVPLMDDLGPDNYADYVKLGLPVVYLFTDKEVDRKTLGALLEPFAKQYKGKMSFTFIDAVKYGGHGKTLNLKDTWPGIAIQDPEKQTKYPFDQSTEYTKDALTTYFADFMAGNLEPSLKSEAAPEDNDGPVKIVVGTNFESIVFDKSKDVFIELYAPWCGHCKKLAPIWDELGEHLQGSKVVIAKMDGTENDLPPNAGFAVEGFPTLKLFKADSNEIVDYEGDRSLENLFEFLKENAVHNDSFDAMTASEPKNDEEEDEHDEL